MAFHSSFCFAIIGAALAAVIWHDYQLSAVKQNITIPIIIIVLGNLLLILLWQTLTQNEQHAIQLKSQESLTAVNKLLTNEFDQYFLGLRRLEYRYSQGYYTTDAALSKDAQNYLHDMPALTGLMITGKKANDSPPLLQMRTIKVKHLIQRCATLHQRKLLQNNSIIVMPHLQKNYLCLANPVSQQQLLVALFDIYQLTNDAVKQILDKNDYVIQLLYSHQVLYQSHYKNTIYQRKLGSSMPVSFKNISLQLYIWPSVYMVKRYQSWLPIITLFAGLFVTFLLAFLVHLFQLLTQKEKKFRSVLNTTSDAVIIFNRNSEVTLANQAALKLFEYTEDEILGMSVESLMPERFRKAHKVSRHNYMKSPDVREMGVANNIILLTKHGNEIPVDIGLNPLQINLEQCILCSIHDMRTAKANENQLMQQSRTMQVMLDITNAIVAENNPDMALQHCLTIICTSFKWPIGHVYFVDENNKELLIPSEIWFLKDAAKASCFRDLTMKTTLSYGVGLPGRVLASGAPAWIDDVCFESNFPREPAAKADNVHSAFAFPITMHGKIRGVFEFFSHEPRKQDSSLLLIINVLKNQISQFLEYQAIQDLNKNLATRFKFAVASGKIGVWEYVPSSKKLIWDEQMYQMYGVSPEITNLSYLTWENTLHPDDAKNAADELQHAIVEERPFDTVFRIVKPSGEVRHIKANAMVIHPADGSSKIVLGLNRDITEEKQLTEKLEQLNDTLAQQAYYDSLTGLMNRHALADAATRLFSLAQRYNYQLGILFIDLDNFKSVNDQFGHKVGDELLVAVAKRMKKIVRLEDAVCRIGGDEFSVILNKINNTAAALLIANKIVDGITQPFHLTSHEVHIGASVGISLYPQSGKIFADLLNKADAALLQAKNTGKGCVHVFKEEE